VALVESHCDDFYIHGLTKEKTTSVVFLDKAVGMGEMCHPGKLTALALQAVKYTGLIFDMTTAPKLIIPEDKHAKAMVMIDNVRCTSILCIISAALPLPRGYMRWLRR
jgi:hypothetical protein